MEATRPQGIGVGKARPQKRCLFRRRTAGDVIDLPQVDHDTSPFHADHGNHSAPAALHSKNARSALLGGKCNASAGDRMVAQLPWRARSDQSFGKAILLGRGRCDGLVPDAHGAQSAGDDAAVDPVAIADEVVRSFIPRRRLRYLTRNLFGRRICRVPGWAARVV